MKIIMDANESVKTISNCSDNDLKILAKQVLTLLKEGTTVEFPLRELIDSFQLGSVYGMIAVPQLVLQECTKRWMNKIENKE